MRGAERRAWRRRCRRFDAIHSTNPDECAYCHLGNVIAYFEWQHVFAHAQRSMAGA